MRKHQQEISNLGAYLSIDISRCVYSTAAETESNAIRKTDGCLEVLERLSGFCVVSCEPTLHLTTQINRELKSFALSCDL